MEILSAVVRDGANNPLPNVKVMFQITDGFAFFTDMPGAVAAADGQSIIVSTDKNGVVGVRPSMGNQAGIVKLSAFALAREGGSFEVPADTVGGAHYVVRAKQARNGPASFSGFVYSDKGEALAGVKLSIARTSLLATSDERGFFELNNVPPGRVDLFVDGRAVNPSNDPSKPQWPSLHFEAYIVRGQSNELPHAIYLPALLTSEAKLVGGAQDVLLQIPGLEGFSMKVKAGSVTFPDGSREGLLVVSPVTADKLPMAPPAGAAQFGVPAWTIQPSGTRFDPPIEVTLPNSTLELAGDNLPVVQWDHDLGQYVPMGRATVSADGALLVTDAGSGVSKAGWGGLCRYDDCKTAVSKCPECKKLDYSGKCPTCQFDPAQDGKILPPVLSTQLEFETKIKSDLFKELSKVASKVLPVDLSLKTKGKITVKQEDRCCARKRGQAQTKTLAGTAELEFEWKFTPPIFKGLSIFGDFAEADIDLLTVKIKALIGAGGNGEYKGCTDQAGINLTGAAGITGELALVKLGWPKAKPELDLEGIVGVTNASVCKGKALSIATLGWNCTHQILAYIKADAKAFDRKWTAINLAWPAKGSSSGTLDY